MCLGLKEGHYLFSTFTLQPGRIDFGSALIRVQFLGNVPPGLTVGKAIAPGPDEPLTLLWVSRSPDGQFLLVDAVSQSLP